MASTLLLWAELDFRYLTSRLDHPSMRSPPLTGVHQDISRLKEELKRNGVRDKIYHSKILQESQAVLALHEQLVPLRASLESYKGLPPDLRLAKQHVNHLQILLVCSLCLAANVVFP